MVPWEHRSMYVILLALWLGVMSSCGGAGRLTSPTPVRDQCPSEDTYLADFYTLVEQGKLSTISQVLRDELDYDIQSDLAIAMIRLVGWVPAGTFEGLQVLGDEIPSEEPQGEELAILTRWIAQNGPNAPYSQQFTVIRSMVETCPGESTLNLAASFLKDTELMAGGDDLLGSVELDVVLAEFELEDEKGRAAVKALVRNLLATLASSDFDVNALLDIVGLLLDLEEGPGVQFRELMNTFLSDGVHRDALVDLVACVQATDQELYLIDLLYDILTDDALAITQLFDSDENDASKRTGQRGEAESANGVLPVILEGLSTDRTVRRGVSKVLGLMLHPDHATGVLLDVANILEANLLDNFIQLAAAYATKSCE